MVLRIALYVLMALGLAGFGSVAWIATRPPHHAVAAKPAPKPPALEAVLTAARPLRAGALLKPEDIASRKLPKAHLPEGAMADTAVERAGLFGAMVRHGVAAGAPLLPADVMRPGDHGFLAAVLAPGMVAVTVAVDVVSGTAGLIWPGDRVDLILTQTLTGADIPAGRRVAAETLLAAVRVIAIDQQLVQGAVPDAAAPHTARTVTLEVSPAAAARVSVAMRLGRLSLAVRSADGSAPATAQATAPGGVTWAADVSPALDDTPPQAAPGVMRVYQGASDGKEFHFP